jgi:predicted site-specific integrase-resolvase
MSDKWLTITEAANRLGVDRRSIRRYITRDGVVELAGRVRESDIVAAAKNARQRATAGRPKGTDS